MKRINSFQQPGERYTSLRVVAFLTTLMGTLMMAGSLLMLVVGFLILVGSSPVLPQHVVGPLTGNPSSLDPARPWVTASFAFFWSFLLLMAGLQGIAYGTIFRLMIHVEENTRATAQGLDRIRSRLESSPEGVEPWFRS
jgi:predicted DNA repair protein MutK